MAKLPRIFQRIFGSTGDPTQFGVFGSLAGGSPTTGKNLDAIQARANFTDGWFSAIIGSNSPTIEDMNGLFLLLFSQLAYTLQSGVPEFDASTDYYKGCFCTYGGILYYSITDANSGNVPPASPTNWIPYDTTRSGVILPFAGVAAPVNYGLCDGGTEVRTDKAALFANIAVLTTANTVSGSNILSGIPSTSGMAAGYPVSGPGIQSGTVVSSVDSGTQIHVSKTATAAATAAAIAVAPWGVGDGTTTFNRPDLRGRTLIGAGTGTGLTARTIGAFLGEENHILSIGEIPPHNHQQNITTSAAPTTPPGTAGNSSNGGVQVSSNYTEYQGGGGAHNNMQPSAVSNFIIKY